MGLKLATSFLLLMLQESLLICQGLPLNNRVKKQAVMLDWTISEWSECTVTCGGGLQTRSVRCLDEDGVISQECDDQNRPASYQFCGQIDCTTSAPTPNALPPSGEYNWISGDGTSTVLSFNNQGGGNYIVQQNTTESDQTLTVVDETVTPTQQSRQVQVFGRANVISFQQSGGESSLVVDGNNILSLNDIQQVSFVDGQGIGYDDGVLSGLDGSVLADGVNQLYLYDGFRFYLFENDKINNISGPGSLYFNPIDGVGLFSTFEPFNQRFDNVLALLVSTVEPEITEPPPTTTQAPVTGPTGIVITSSTSTPQPTTTEAPSPTVIVVTGDTTTTVEPTGPGEEEEDETTPRVDESRTPGGRTKTRKGPGDKTRKTPRSRKTPKTPREPGVEQPTEEETTRKTCTKRRCRDKSNPQETEGSTSTSRGTKSKSDSEESPTQAVESTETSRTSKGRRGDKSSKSKGRSRGSTDSVQNVQDDSTESSTSSTSSRSSTSSTSSSRRS